MKNGVLIFLILLICTVMIIYMICTIIDIIRFKLFKKIESSIILKKIEKKFLKLRNKIMNSKLIFKLKSKYC